MFGAAKRHFRGHSRQFLGDSRQFLGDSRQPFGDSRCASSHPVWSRRHLEFNLSGCSVVFATSVEVVQQQLPTLTPETQTKHKKTSKESPKVPKRIKKSGNVVPLGALPTALYRPGKKEGLEKKREEFWALPLPPSSFLFLILSLSLSLGLGLGLGPPARS